MTAWQPPAGSKGRHFKLKQELGTGFCFGLAEDGWVLFEFCGEDELRVGESPILPNGLAYE